MSKAMKGRNAWNEGVPCNPEWKRKLKEWGEKRTREAIGHRHFHKSTGYIRVFMPGHPSADLQGAISEHRLIWEKVHGRKLPRGWIIHHLNGIKSDNKPENLFAISKRKHMMLLEPLKKRIRELEEKIRLLEQPSLFG